VRPKLEPPPRKPLAFARRVSLFEREVAVRLAPVAIELLHDAARTLTEGELVGDGYTGSTMLTIDLQRTRAQISDPPDASTAQRVALLYASDSRCREHARRMAGCDLSLPHIDVESRARGPELHLSLNVEAQRERRGHAPGARAAGATADRTRRPE